MERGSFARVETIEATDRNVTGIAVKIFDQRSFVLASGNSLSLEKTR